MENTQEKKTNSTMMGLVVVAAIAIIAFGAYAFMPKNSQESAKETMVVEVTTAPMPTTADVATNGAMMEKTGTYKDGVYKAVGSYTSPGGPEEVGVNLTLKGGMIESIEVEKMATRPKSVVFQEEFASGYKPMVLGKNIDEVELTKVSGSSLTPKGFNDAIEKIKTQAKS